MCNRSFARVAAGASWTSRTTSAPWAARYGHTTVIDAAGAIYVIGGYGGMHGSTSIYFNDVLVSTDGGADRTQAVLGGYSRVLPSIRGYLVVPRCTKGVLRALEGYSG